jgi:mRNA-degrading endonuclease RelE of RelBE toxin-antitoxin system
MFSKSFLISIVFLGLTFVQGAYAYRSEGVERINPTSYVKLAEKEGLGIQSKERAVKKDLQKLKRTRPKEFEKKIAQGLENPPYYQGYLLEIKEGLQNVEKAKKIAKYLLYKKVESDWKIIKTSALNSRADSTFAKFKNQLKSDLNNLYYVKYDEGYLFQVGLWGEVTVSKNLKVVNWKIEFNSKYDSNRLEEGALDIQIQEDPKPQAPSGDGDFGDDYLE